MDQSLSDAIALVRGTNTDTPEDPARYLAACELIAANRSELILPLAIRVPGACGTANTDSAWDKVRAASESGCSCGNERTIFPLEMRNEFKASETPPLVIKGTDEVYIKLRGDPNHAALFAVNIEDGHFVIEDDPFRQEDLGSMLANMLGLPSAARARGAKLTDLVKALSDGGGKLVFDRGQGDRKIFIFAITGVDPDANTATITLDEVAESFTLDDIIVHSGESGVSFLN